MVSGDQLGLDMSDEVSWAYIPQIFVVLQDKTSYGFLDDFVEARSDQPVDRHPMLPARE